MGYVKEIIDRFLKIQDRFYRDVKEYTTGADGRVSLLRVVGIDGDSVLLKYQYGRIRYANENEEPVHIFRCTVDSFLNILSGDEDMREAITKGHFVIEDARDGNIDVVECEKWAKAFSRMRGILGRYFA
ncbi:MAG: hypothetical protein JRD89_00570 [Deltaproteobacteria bacterium]|nr:hypothetical protein [Deltaproteobacteria bacterium]